MLGLDPPAAPARVTSKAASARGTTSPAGFTGGTDVDYTTSPARRITFPASEVGETQLAWESPGDDNQVRIFRVVARPDTTPYDLDLGATGRLVAVTFDSGAVDDAPLTEAKRFYAVFLNVGPSEAEARASKPVLYAEGTAIQPVHNAQISTTGRRVSGRWNASAETNRVEILRVPVEDPPIPADIYDTDYLISGSQAGQNLGGFADEDVPSGTWEYRLYACAEGEGTTQRSSVVRSVQTVAIDLPVVDDLRVDIVDDDRFVVSWTPLADPGLSVRIHKRLEDTPPTLANRTIDRGSLERNGFTASTAITDPERLVLGRVQVESPWLSGENRVYFSAVTVPRGLDLCRVSRAVLRHRVGEVRHLQLVERVDEQFLSFAWPDGAGVVKIHQGSSDIGFDQSDPSTLPELAELTPRMHGEYGGMHLGPLPAEGAVLHVFGLSFHEAKPIQGPPAMVHYPGLIRINYEMISEWTQVRRGLRKIEEETGKQVLVTSNVDTSVRLVLVLNRDRLPLHQDDGERRVADSVSLQRGVPYKMTAFPLGAVNGFLRLFVDLPDHQQEAYAVSDPPIEQLTWEAI